jgi:hypothetical protein
MASDGISVIVVVRVKEKNQYYVTAYIVLSLMPDRESNVS